MLEGNKLEEVHSALRNLQGEIFENNVKKGWWQGRDPKDVNTRLGLLMLICTEVAEGAEEVRTGQPLYYTNKNCTNGVQPMMTWEEPLKAPAEFKPEGLGSELADVVIRCMDMAGGLGLDLGACILAKMRYNETREFRHGNKLA